MAIELTNENLKPPRISEPIRSRGRGIVSHDTRPVGYGPAIGGAGGGCIGAASPQLSA